MLGYEIVIAYRADKLAGACRLHQWMLMGMMTESIYKLQQYVYVDVHVYECWSKESNLRLPSTLPRPLPRLTIISDLAATLRVPINGTSDGFKPAVTSNNLCN